MTNSATEFEHKHEPLPHRAGKCFLHDDTGYGYGSVTGRLFIIIIIIKV